MINKLISLANRRYWFSSFHEHTDGITIDDSSTIPIRGTGTISIFHFSNVLYVPDLGFNLLSVSSLMKQGAFAEFTADHVTIRDLASGSTLASGQQDGGLYKFMDLVSQSAADDALWHARFGHLSYSYLQQAHKDDWLMVCQQLVLLLVCASLVFVASKPKSLSRRRLLIELQNHLSLFIPHQESLNDALYMMLIIDHFTRYTWVYFLKSKESGSGLFFFQRLESRS